MQQVRTENPGEANLFYIPAQGYPFLGNELHHRGAVDHVKQKHPELWARNQGGSICT